MLTPAQAWDAIEATGLGALPAEILSRSDALFRVLAEDLPATVDQPMADVSAMDGYALAGDSPVGVILPVVDVAAAGRPAAGRLLPGQAIKIMTGAVVPEGADRVVVVEATDNGQHAVRLDAVPGPGENIRLRGEIVRRGEPLLRAGTLLTPGALSLVAGHGHGLLPVHRAPRVFMLTTGDEIVAPEEEPGPGQLRDSNTVFLAAAGRSLGLEFAHLGIARDDKNDLETRIAQGLEGDVLLLCGGVSKGDFDFVEDVLADLGCERIFDAVAIQPGKPLVFARHKKGCRVLGLPGNPASVMTCFWLFGRPLLRRLLGQHDHFWQGALDAEAQERIGGARGRDRFVPAIVWAEEGRLRARPQPPKGSHDVSTFAQGTGLLRIPHSKAAINAGETCQILPLASWPLFG